MRLQNTIQTYRTVYIQFYRRSKMSELGECTLVNTYWPVAHMFRFPQVRCHKNNMLHKLGKKTE